VPDPSALHISIVDSGVKGAPTASCRRADGREFWLHSRVDPQEEARQLVQELPAKERTLYVVLGFGLGYHVRELLQRIPSSSHVLVMESVPACLSARLRAHTGSRTWAWTTHPRLHFLAHKNPQVAPLSLADRLTTWRLLALELFTHEPSVLTDEVFYKALLDEIPRRFPACYQSRLASLDTMLENHLRNFWANLPYSWRAIPAQNLSGLWQGRRLILVAAGPSLTDALPILRVVQGQDLILATATTVRLLAERQIKPDLVISMDPYPANLAHFQGWDTPGVPLVYYHQIYRKILEVYAGPLFFFTMQDDPPLPARATLQKSDFRQGGSVAFSALQLAHAMKADPVIFVGQDFAFPGNHTHARGTAVDQALDPGALPADCLLVPGVDGHPVLTNRIYHAYLLYMQDYLLTYARQNPGVRHINTSRIGAKIEGMDCLTLEQALALPGSAARISPGKAIGTKLDERRNTSVSAQRTAVRRWRNELGSLLHAASLTQDFPCLFERFMASSLYAQAARRYDDIFYIYEARYRERKDSGPPSFLDRFRTHLDYIMTEMIRAHGDVV
jgi:uncharacterized Rossmann fold enzyme